jgi:hypothetical protein
MGVKLSTRTAYICLDMNEVSARFLSVRQIVSACRGGLV